ncbi:GNAT family N-acetyltransferase [Mucilaginibacter roseus]|uniref:GNAT family N-acetyltransferase n=1 Tax=Mucilaginibacter roseus TaxID=1528868 RepID=A0ABS8U7U2_9SPHI|nr:GNAT family N-acetyltransferase [Mucilaginibacter roseus]MCD8742004.1 GNAT family N-acetyltransferase [Mucilaginibacter roseus]
MTTLQSERLLLQPLTVGEKEAFYNLYLHNDAITGNETPLAFTQRIISACHIIWTIRLIDNSENFIGDCALHHFDQQKSEIQIGGSLSAIHQRKGYMAEAFRLVECYAKDNLQVKHLLGVTTIDNSAAISLVEELGFEKHSVINETIILRKSL